MKSTTVPAYLKCSVLGCRRPQSSYRLCRTHRRRQQRHGDPEIGGRLRRAELVRLRVAVGLDPTGPTAEQLAAWQIEDNDDHLGKAS